MSEIDLTDRRQYSRLGDNPRLPISEETRLMLEEMLEKHRRAVDLTNIFHNSHLFWCGTNEDIAFYEEIYEVEQGLRCDCCGKPLNIPPWNPGSTLCKECEKHMDMSLFGPEKPSWYVRKMETREDREEKEPWWMETREDREEKEPWWIETREDREEKVPWWKDI